MEVLGIFQIQKKKATNSKIDLMKFKLGEWMGRRYEYNMFL